MENSTPKNKFFKSTLNQHTITFDNNENSKISNTQVILSVFQQKNAERKLRLKEQDDALKKFKESTNTDIAEQKNTLKVKKTKNQVQRTQPSRSVKFQSNPNNTYSKD